jgi:radical SAM protein with 4Fe4S-binding SPASM domain
MPFENLISIVEQYKDSLDYFSKKSGRKIYGHITVTGGEPFARKDFPELMDYLHINRDRFSYSILTNGTLIGETEAELIAKYRPAYVQVSIEGKKETHENIRGQGSYDKTKKALELLVEQEINTVVSFTAHNKNKNEFHDVVETAYKVQANRVWSDRLLPYGNGKEMKEMMFSPQETKEFFYSMKHEKEILESRADNKTEVAMHRALQFMCGGSDYKCNAGKSFITVDYNGDVYPCRRMPIKVGNVMDKSILEIYKSSKVFKKLRDDSNCSGECKACTHFEKCKGGLRCLSYATTGNPQAKDPGCWL